MQSVELRVRGGGDGRSTEMLLNDYMTIHTAVTHSAMRGTDLPARGLRCAGSGGIEAAPIEQW